MRYTSTLVPSWTWPLTPGTYTLNDFAPQRSPRASGLPLQIARQPAV